MKQFIKIILMITLTVCISSSALAVDFRELLWEQQGHIRLRLGYLSGEGVVSDFRTLYDVFLYSYSMQLSGMISKGQSNLSYQIKKEVNDEVDWNFHLNNSKISAVYDKGVKIDFPEVNLAFRKNAINGLKMQTYTDNTELTVFAGKEANFPMTIIVRGVMEGTSKIRLFDYHLPESIPASGGDIIEYSEIITVNGILLEREKDYTLNYLNSDLSLLTPIRSDAVLEAKFQFVPTKEELSLPAELLKGIVLTGRWLENNLTAFSVKRGANLNQVSGFAGQFREGPVSISGEWAVSDSLETDLAKAYYLNVQLMDDILKATYNLSKVEDDFRELGVNVFTRGSSQKFNLDYQCSQDVDLGVEYSAYYDSKTDQLINRLIKETIGLQITPNQSCQFIMKDVQLQEADLIKDKKDIALSYQYSTDALTLTLGQYLYDTDDRFMQCSVGLPNFNLGAEYKVEERVKGKIHRLNVVNSYRPIQMLDLNSILEYSHPFDAKKGDLRLIVNGNTFAIPGFTANGQYVYFTEQTYNGQSSRYYLNLTNDRFSNSSQKLEFMHFDTESATAKSYIQEITGSSDFIFWEKVSLGYSGKLNGYHQESKELKAVYNGSKTYLHELILGYLCSEALSLKTKVGYTNTDNWSIVFEGQEDAVIHNKSDRYSYGIAVDYTPSYSKVINLAFDYDPNPADSFILSTLKVDYSLLDGLLLKGTSSVNYSMRTGEFSERKYNLTLNLPEILHIIPKVTMSEDHSSSTTSPLDKIAYIAELKYCLNEEQAIFIEGRRDYLKNVVDDTVGPEVVVDSFGILLGVEYGF